MIDKKVKQRYNLTYKLRKKGYDVHSQSREIAIYMRQFKDILNDNHAQILVKDHGFKLVQNKQLELF